MNTSNQNDKLSFAIAALVSTIGEMMNEKSMPLVKPSTAHPLVPTETKNGLPRLAFSAQETAEILGVSDKTVYRLIERRLLKSSSVLRHKIIPRTEIERFLKQSLEQ